MVGIVTPTRTTDGYTLATKDVARILGLSRQMVELLDDVLCPTIRITPGGHKKRRYHPAHIARIAAQRARARAEQDVLRGR